MWLFLASSVAAVALAHAAPFPFLLEYLGPNRSVWHVPSAPGETTVYLTYDDGPNPAATPALLDVLAREDVRATFFLIPRYINESTAGVVRRIFDEGHGVALHSHTRVLMLEKPDDLARLLATQAAEIERLAGRPPCKLFRPHAGWRGGEMYAGLDQVGYRLAGWTPGMWDWNWWRAADRARLTARLAARASDGDIIVMHDGHHSDPMANRQRTIEVTSDLVPLLKGRGVRFGTLCQAIDQN
jgi:peptidoglycan/xylan/chitin deacetylase (PgdA/CDA1 family)